MTRTKLFKYQQQIVNDETWKLSHSHALFLDMGCGKTLTSIGLTEEYDKKKILVICMCSKLHDWKRDFELELNKWLVVLDQGGAKNKKLISQFGNKCDGFVINFESAWRIPELLLWIDKDTQIIIDESHKVKNPKSQIGKFCQKLAKKTDYKIILTGTPQSQGYIDYYNQLYFIDVLKMKFKEFQDRYCIYDTRNYNGFPIKQLVGYKNTEELDKIINENCVFFKRDVNNELIPENIIQYFDKPKIYSKFKKDRVYKDVVADNQGKLFVTLRTICSGYIEENRVDDQKLQWVEDLLQCTNDRIVIFYNFNIERDSLITLAVKNKIPYSEYNGRNKSFEEFLAHSNGIILCQYKSASLGINELVASNICVLYSLPLEYIDYIQSKKRIDRIGQVRKPLFYYLICRDTLEEKILTKLNEGKNFDDKMFETYINE